MKKKKAKKILVPVILLVVIAALIFGYVILKDKNEKAEEAADTTEAEEKITVLDKSSRTVTKIKIGEGELSFTYVNDKWQWDGDDYFPLDASQMSTMASALSLVEASAEVTNKGELSEYGLDEPTLVVCADFSDDTSVTYSFGATNDFNGLQYFTLSGDDNIYMLDQSVAELFNTDIETLYGAESCPIVENSVQATNVTSILIENGDKSNEITDEEGISELFTSVYALNLTDWEDYYANENDMKTIYGIDENSAKVTITYTLAETSTDEDGNSTTVDVPYKYTALIGNKFETEETDDDGNTVMGYFYTTEGSTVVYSIDADQYDAIMEYLSYVPEETTAE